MTAIAANAVSAIRFAEPMFDASLKI